MLGAILPLSAPRRASGCVISDNTATLAVIAGLFALIALGALLAALFLELET